MQTTSDTSKPAIPNELMQRGSRQLDTERCYEAICTKDSNFDGYFFVGVSSTGIYCRPICRVKTPKQKNCHFFSIAAQAEAAGFRPCLRCRPELAPENRHWSSEDAGVILAREAAALLDGGRQYASGHANRHQSITAIAQRLGISDRHLRRVFESYWGISPLQYRQTQRLLRAKQLLVDSQLPMSRIATLSGFSSLRRFNDSFQAHYQLSPSQLRAVGFKHGFERSADSVTVRLDYRPPFDVQAMLGFWQQRAIHGLELIGHNELFRTIVIDHHETPSKSLIGWIRCIFHPIRPQLNLTLSESLLPALHRLLKIVRDAFDLDADPALIHAQLSADFPDGEGLRVPGAFDGFELAVRAILGQQVTVAAARIFAQRLVDRFGMPLRPVVLPSKSLNPTNAAPGNLRLFPRPQALIQASSDALGSLGIVKQRQAAIDSVAKALLAGELRLEPIAHDKAAIEHTVHQLCKLPGIGAWTAQYIAMRALKSGDALPAGDLALHRALGLQGTSRVMQQTLDRSKTWIPWRSYAVIRAWHSIGK